MMRLGSYFPIRTYLGQDGGDRAAGETNVSSTSTKQGIDVAGRTRGSDQTNHRPWSSRHLMSLHPPTSSIPYCLSSRVVRLLKILTIWMLSLSRECRILPRFHSFGYFLSSPLKLVVLVKIRLFQNIFRLVLTLLPPKKKGRKINIIKRRKNSIILVLWCKMV